MKFDPSAVRSCLKSFEFSTLFREHLGWDNHHARLDIPVNDAVFALTAIAQKRGFVAYVCPTIPDRPTRLKIDHKVTKAVREHFVIYSDQEAGRQVWHWVRREPGKPIASRDHRFEVSQSGDPLIQRLDQIAISMDEEEGITVVDVSGRVKAALDVDKVTRKFYDRFKAEHAAFMKLIKEIKTEIDLAWYTSLMLNRLMFVYFIQRKGFLDGDTHYLRNRLEMVQQLQGKDKFQTFYRYFLLRLFHEGLGKSAEERQLDPTLERLLGNVPFLNGGFFEVHQLEEQNPEMDIPDKAFEKLFAFFDQYQWHLDERPLRADNEINPDVVGYIFEKYINQKQMGAYYTKEDITEYISKNTLIPFLFDAAEKKCPIAFKPDGFLWGLLREDPDRYIYPAVKHGVICDDGSIVPETDLPDFVQTGMHDPKARMFDRRYNLQQAPAEDALRLVTETWREYIYRRNRCLEIRGKLIKGEVHQINELITYNLDIWQFARDAIITSEGPELLRAFWEIIKKVRILDPTCGSGAFLFAVLCILETLYSDCLERMARFIDDMEGKPHHPKQYADFKAVLAQVRKHPSESYFILKSIIINNLYGVDIMAEAVEICKLRLFLKLVAQVEKVGQIEPLPDIDFNIRSGNTLVGYATEEQARQAFTEKAAGMLKQTTLMFGEITDAYQRFEEDLLVVDKTLQQFRDQQTTHGGKVTHKDKQDLLHRMEKLNAEMDRHLAFEYGIAPNNYPAKPKAYEAAFAQWKATHQPFHWFVEFYGIMNSGGFDVIIGNPPYVEYSKIKKQYTLLNYSTLGSANLYAFASERSLQLLNNLGSFGFIVPISSVCTQRMKPMQDKILFSTHSAWFSNYAERPSKLFEGAEVLLTIVLARVTGNGRKTQFTTGFAKWAAEERPCLFERVSYCRLDVRPKPYVNPKLSDETEISILGKLFENTGTLGIDLKRNSTHRVYYRIGGGRYWKIFTRFQPQFVLNGKSAISSRENYLFLPSEAFRVATISVLSSSLFYWFFILTTNCRDLNPIDLNEFPIRLESVNEKNMRNLGHLCEMLMNDYQQNSQLKEKTSRLTGKILYQEFYPKLCKPTIDQIDQVLAQHYGFTDEELDFIINYDIKYRMGRDGAGGEEEEE